MPAIRSFVTLCLILIAGQAIAFPQLLNDWNARYSESTAGATANCQLCHANANGGSPWNAYGWELLLALNTAGCDAGGDGSVSNDEAFACVEFFNSDSDTAEADNLAEIQGDTQPGWRLGECNSLYDEAGITNGQPAPQDIGALDPADSTPVNDCDSGSTDPTGPPGAIVTVQPGESIQAAIDSVGPGSTVFIEPGVYTETANGLNGLNITQSGLRIIGLSDGENGVVLENAGNQRNGIVVVPANRTECMSCHESLAPPFTLKAGVVGDGDSSTAIQGFEIRNITIRNFINNGLFTERVDDFKIVNVHSQGNKNYGIFPTLSSNGLVQNSSAVGADDSGIWVETSEHIRVANNVAYGNVNGFEFSNSDYVIVENNEAYDNTVGIALFVLTDLVDERPGSNKWIIRNNHIYNNNKPNSATPGSLLEFLPAGFGILHVGVDNSVIENNHIEGNDFFGIVIVDYCLALQGTDFDCLVVNPPAAFDSVPERNQIRGNTLINNGTNPDLTSPFFFAAADMTLFVPGDYGNCWEDNVYKTYFGLVPQRSCGPLNLPPLVSGERLRPATPQVPLRP